MLAAAVGAQEKTPFSDYRTQKPGEQHRIRVEDLPPPYASKSVDSGPDEIPRPRDASPKVPQGFKVTIYAAGFDYPRLIRTAPNGDVFLAESHTGEIKVLRGIDPEGKTARVSTFARRLEKPFGIAFYPPGSSPQWVYLGNTDSVVRFPYRSGDLEARGPAQPIADLPGGGHLRGGGHWTRDIAFSNDGKKMFASVGSYSNVAEGNARETDRADILEFNPDGSGQRIYASGIRNAVGIAVHPKTGQLWASVNERDGLGDNLPPDYITHVEEGGFYGWPWWYIGEHLDPRHRDDHPAPRKVLVPDVLVQPHNASLEMVFYEASQFPAKYRGGIFAAQHGSWNRALRTGYEIVFVPLDEKGQASGVYEDFMTGFVTSRGDVWGRPVGVAVAHDGSLLVSDDTGKVVWRVTYEGK